MTPEEESQERQRRIRELEAQHKQVTHDLILLRLVETAYQIRKQERIDETEYCI